MQHAVRILALHGIDADDPLRNREVLNTAKSPSEHNKYFRERNQTFVFKSILHRDMKDTTSKSLKKLGTLAVYVTRKNALDHLVCMVRDCFWTNEKYGYPVESNGKKSNLCFKRRSAGEGGGYKAMLRVIEECPHHNRSHLQENIEYTEELKSSGYEELRKAGYKGPRLSSEDLLAFEVRGGGSLQTSLTEWKKLLKAWGVTPNEHELKKYLSSYANTWSQQRQQAEIYNYKEVAAELKNLGREDLLRD